MRVTLPDRPEFPDDFNRRYLLPGNDRSNDTNRPVEEIISCAIRDIVSISDTGKCGFEVLADRFDLTECYCPCSTFQAVCPPVDRLRDGRIDHASALFKGDEIIGDGGEDLICLIPECVEECIP